VSEVRNPATVRRRLVALTGTLAAFVALGLVVVVQIVLNGAASDSVARVLEDRADTLISAAASASPGGTLEVPADRLEPGVAVYDGTGQLVAGNVAPSQQEIFDELSTASTTSVREVDDIYAVLVRPFALADGTSGVAVLSEPVTPYENDERNALLVSVAAGLLMVVLTVVMAAWISRRALAPVQTMAETASEWSEHDLDRRFDLGAPTDEIRALGQTLDELLDKVATTIRAEQRLTSELAHELRSPLTAIQVTAELMSMRTDLDDQLREDVDDVLAGCRAMASTMTVLLEIARRQAEGSPDGSTTGRRLGDAVRRQEPDPRLEVDLPDDLVVSVPVEVVLRVLAPVVDNGLRVADRVVLTTAPGPGSGLVTLHVRDDGPGVDPSLVDRLFQPGTTDREGTGSGLGLSLSRRVARSTGGDVALLDGEGAGTTFVITLPGRGPHSSQVVISKHT
jgi:two-component system, OmpR family, sensor kinase